MKSVKHRLEEAADYLDHLYKGSKQSPTTLAHSEVTRGLVVEDCGSATNEQPVAHFFRDGLPEVFLTLGPASLPLLSRWLRREVEDVVMCDAINAKDPDNPGKTRVMYRPQASNAVAFADHILKVKETAQKAGT